MKEVKIGKQIWMTKNLDVSTFRNGDQIPHAKTDEEWEKAGENKQPAWCHYGNDPTNGAKYGKLYNWYAVNDPRGLAPAGWHISSNQEWTVLTDYLRGEDVAGTKIKSSSGWEENGNGTNGSGFSGVPGGYRDYDGTFNSIGVKAAWWSSSESHTDAAWGRNLSHYSGGVDGGFYDKEGGFSVRCLRD
jgi:uncharacterized protein (TIGR02145 family)